MEQKKSPVQIHLEDQVPIFLFHPQDQPIPGNPSIVDEDVDFAPLLEHPVDHGFHVIPVRHVEFDVERAPPRLLDHTDGLLRPAGIQIGNHDIRPLAGQRFGDRPPDTLGRARHDRNFSFQ